MPKITKRRVTFQTIKDAVSMEDLLGHLGADIPNWRSRNVNGWRSASCPLHEDASDGRSYKHGGRKGNPSGRYTDSLEDDHGNRISKFWCPVCEFSGDQFDLVIAAGKAKNVHHAAGWLSKEFKLGGYAPSEPHTPHEPPYPDDWPDPQNPGWSQDQWAEMITRWMPVARSAVSPKDDRESLWEKFFALINDPDELDQLLRKLICAGILQYESARGGFTTLLQRMVRNRIRNEIRNEIRRRRRLGLPLFQEDPTARTPRGGLKQLRDTEGSPLPSHEAAWVRAIDWDYAIEAAQMELGDEAAFYAMLRGEGFSQREIAETLGVSRKRVRQTEQKFRDWYRDVRGHEAAVYKEAREEHEAV
jgi:DNA-directed RNA polymerase specialized sigma24 family protein